MADELATRRVRKTATSARTRAAAPKPPRKPTKVPFWKWMATQHLHSEHPQRDAAVHIRDRWGYNEYYNHARVIRTLASEESVHLTGARLLADEYATTFELSDDSRLLISGVRSAWFPFAPELCSDCRREAIPGTGRCARHGGGWITEADRLATSRALSEKLEGLGDRAVRTIADLLDHGRSEQVRLMAAQTVLDRIGLQATSNVHVTTDTGPDPADLIRARLERLGVEAAEAIGAAEEVLEGEVVGE